MHALTIMAVDQNAYPGAKGACEESSDHVHVVIASGFTCNECSQPVLYTLWCNILQLITKSFLLPEESVSIVPFVLTPAATVYEQK